MALTLDLSRRILNFLASSKSPPGINPARMQRIAQVVGSRSSLRLVLENCMDPHNASACIRTAESFGIAHVHVIESFSTFRPSETVASGAHTWTLVHHHPSVEHCRAALAEANCALVASDLSGNATELLHGVRSWLPSLSTLTTEQRRALTNVLDERAAIAAIRLTPDSVLKHEAAAPPTPPATPIVKAHASPSLNLSCAVAATLGTLQGINLLDGLPMSQDEQTILQVRFLLSHGSRTMTELLRRAGIEVPGL
ncbi:hypothetical protein CAOG_004980 [Capsaspora owczarzaki ATCC 30864]|uniref:tRNA/rRNA methyltransferase SpoU type domain-containing protein n=1 Tax=Capsaspora owczarzaki (strain ATCC 30864) TaxID=595528 RepID=A0A0D2UGU7_CAPO3|nr:hypothetical protein CAOG_004980 [Capsaspora owczarzaki ATCC 30864]